jgi:hypothetical protein
MLVGMGKRGAVDQCLWRLVSSGELERVARGVFCKGRAPDDLTIEKLAEVKAKAFGKKIFQHGLRKAAELEFGEAPKKLHYATDGCTSSFYTIFGRVYMRSVSAKKRAFGTGENQYADALKGLWASGESRLAGLLHNVKTQLGSNRSLPYLAKYSDIPPAWLMDSLPKAPHLVAKLLEQAAASARSRNHKAHRRKSTDPVYDTVVVMKDRTEKGFENFARPSIFPEEGMFRLEKRPRGDDYVRPDDAGQSERTDKPDGKVSETPANYVCRMQRRRRLVA